MNGKIGQNCLIKLRGKYLEGGEGEGGERRHKFARRTFCQNISWIWSIYQRTSASSDVLKRGARPLERSPRSAEWGSG